MACEEYIQQIYDLKLMLGFASGVSAVLLVVVISLYLNKGID